jgi:hypothetical protein
MVVFSNVAAARHFQQRKADHAEYLRKNPICEDCKNAPATRVVDHSLPLGVLECSPNNPGKQFSSTCDSCHVIADEAAKMDDSQYSNFLSRRH